MKKFLHTVNEEQAYNASIGYNAIVLVLMVIALISSLFGPGGEGGLVISAILGVPFLAISFFRNITLVAKTTTRGRKLYAIITSILTGGILVLVLFAIVKK